MKVTSPDYKDMDKEKAVEDFKLRIQHYEEMYEPIDEHQDKEMSFIKIFNQGEKFLVNKVKGICIVLKSIFYQIIGNNQSNFLEAIDEITHKHQSLSRANQYVS